MTKKQYIKALEKLFDKQLSINNGLVARIYDLESVVKKLEIANSALLEKTKELKTDIALLRIKNNPHIPFQDWPPVTIPTYPVYPAYPWGTWCKTET